MRILSDVKLDFDDVLIVPKRSTITSRSEVDLVRDIKFPYSEYIWSGVPIMSSNMTTVSSWAVADILRRFSMITVMPKSAAVSDWDQTVSQYVVPSIGIQDKDAIMFDRIYKETLGEVFGVVVDTPNGYMERFVEFVKRLREKYRSILIVAGNVVTPEMTEALILAGADAVKVGIGSGSACLTRIKTGVGYPQLSAIIECADAAHGLKGLIVSDGGCRNPSDVAKAFCAGADFVMLGGMLAGHDESPGLEIDGKKEFYGMSSAKAQGGLNSYRASEGRELLIPKKGKLEDTIKDILGGLRSVGSYIGARKIKEFPKRATFARVRSQYNDVYE